MSERFDNLEEILNRGDMRKVNSHLLDAAAYIKLPGTDPSEREGIHITEKVFQSQVEKLLKMNGWKYYHTFNSIHSVGGFPDIVAVRGKRLIFAELKAEGKHPAPKQEEWLSALSITGAEVYVWHPRDYSNVCIALGANGMPVPDRWVPEEG